MTGLGARDKSDRDDYLKRSITFARENKASNVVNFPAALQAPIAREGLAAITARPITWLWHEHIPEGEITLLAGRQGCGKSTIAAHFAAIVSCAGRWPDGASCKAGAVEVFTTEDNVSKVLKPRIAAAIAEFKGDEAAMANVSIVTDDRPMSVVLPALLQILKANPPRLLILDPSDRDSRQQEYQRGQ